MIFNNLPTNSLILLRVSNCVYQHKSIIRLRNLYPTTILKYFIKFLFLSFLVLELNLIILHFVLHIIVFHFLIILCAIRFFSEFHLHSILHLIFSIFFEPLTFLIYINSIDHLLSFKPFIAYFIQLKLLKHLLV